jgi:hypothetical protein
MTEPTWPLDDEPLQFYLRHRSRIEEWASLRERVSAATAEAFMGLRPRIEALARELGVESRLENTDAQWPRYVLLRPEWRAADGSLVGLVALEIDKRKVMADSPSDSPYVGIRMLDVKGRGRSLRDEVLAEDWRKKGYTKGLEYAGVQVVYHRVTATPGWWEDPEAWEVSLVDALRNVWRDFSGLIDQASTLPRGVPQAAS